MLSVLIPTFNYNVKPLVLEVHEQCVEAGILFEIIVIDDVSSLEFMQLNQSVQALASCNFFQLSKNIGRSKIRNLLAQKAQYKWLLFLDADVLPTQSLFIKNYLNQINLQSKKTVYCGGLEYKDDKNHDDLLRYKFGKANEAISLKKRQQKPYKYFFTSNFLIQKSAFNILQFQEKLSNYGKEDYLFSMDLKDANFTVKHIENQVYHLGIDADAVFLEKTKKALENIIFLEQEGLLTTENTTILQVVHQIKKLRLLSVLSKFTNFFEKITLKTTNLHFFNGFRICYLCRLFLIKNRQ